MLQNQERQVSLAPPAHWLVGWQWNGRPVTIGGTAMGTESDITMLSSVVEFTQNSVVKPLKRWGIMKEEVFFWIQPPINSLDLQYSITQHLSAAACPWWAVSRIYALVQSSVCHLCLNQTKFPVILFAEEISDKEDASKSLGTSEINCCCCSPQSDISLHFMEC